MLKLNYPLHQISFLHRSSKRFKSFFDKSGRSWENAWKENNTPWETGSPSAGLIHAFENPVIKSTLVHCKRALIPGCGSGYDVKYLHSLNVFDNITGIDISEAAIKLVKTTSTNCR